LTAKLTAVSDEDLYRDRASSRFRQIFAPVSYSRDPKTPKPGLTSREAKYRRPVAIL
jgi:hypothetical protein